ncbi:DEAD/DEAH box helicase, partial [Candidatus Woesearchaeota archaeon]|nr:DEAD/DEAH box helicase [Candidatus Woesearchaeota archaeon]
MISFIKDKYKDEEIFKVLNPLVRNWFKNKFKGFSDPQRYAILPIHNRENILVSAVTGSGKTLTAFTSVLSELITLAENDLLENQIYCIYISPLKSLNNDISFNLEEPLREMEEAFGKKFGIRVGVRTGDTSTADKAKMLAKSPHILITTPESFSIILTSVKLRDKLRNLKWVIIDEIHALAENKRGVHLSLALERLEDLSLGFTRIGLSATIEPVEEVAGFLVGSKRKCLIAKADLKKEMDIKVLCPVPDLINVTYEEVHDKMYKMIDELIQSHNTTLIFTNT